MTSTTLAATQRIAAVLRQRGIERTPSDILPWLSRRFDLYRVARPLADFDTFAANAAKALELGEPTWLAVLVREFGGTL